jgi:hypothetical protein
MFDGVEFISDDDFNPQLLPNFSLKRCFERFPRFYFATRKLP